MNKQFCRLIKGHTLEVLGFIPRNKVQLIITSPPYWKARIYGDKEVKFGNWFGKLGQEKDPDLFIDHLIMVFDKCKRVLTLDGALWVNIGDKYHNKCLMEIPSRFVVKMIKRGWILRNTIIWYKPNAMPNNAKDRFDVDFEYFYFFVKNKDYSFNQQKVPIKESSKKRMEYPRYAEGSKGMQGEYAVRNPEYNPRDFRNMRSVWKISLKPVKQCHYAVFPKDLIKPPIMACSNPGDIILDPFNGSGTTGIVSLKNKRSYYGIDLYKENLDISKERLEDEKIDIPINIIGV